MYRNLVLLLLLLPSCSIVTTLPTKHQEQVKNTNILQTITPNKDNKSLNPSPKVDSMLPEASQNQGKVSPEKTSIPQSASVIPPIPSDLKPTVLDISKTTEQVISSQNPKPVFSKNNPVPDIVTSGSVSVIFKDNYKVRYYKDKNLFISKTGVNVDEINVIVRKYKVTKIGGSDLSNPRDLYGNMVSEDVVEKKAAEDEKFIEDRNGPGYDYPNQLSMYEFYVENVNIKTMIEEIRNHFTVLSSNYNGSGPTTNDIIGYDSAGRCVYNCPSTSTTLSPTPIASPLSSPVNSITPFPIQTVTGTVVKFYQVKGIFINRCVTCHSLAADSKTFFSLETEEGIRLFIPKIKQRVVVEQNMPENNKTNMTYEERSLIATWIDQGAQ